MPWKEPGDKPREPRGRGPWGPGPGGKGGGPDLDAWFKKLRRVLGPFGRGPLGVVGLLVALVILWFLIGAWTNVGDQQVGVVSRFGRFERVLQPGMHVHFPAPIDQVTKLEMGHARSVGDEARLLTSDGQLVLLDYAVQYKVTNAREFLFTTRDAEEVLRGDAVAAARAAVGTHSLACLLDTYGLACASGRVSHAQLAEAMRARLEAALAAHGDALGLALTDVTIHDLGVPSDVKPAFDGIAKAHADAKAAAAAATADVARAKVRAGSEATAIHADAEAYSRKTVAQANLTAAQFDQVLTEYQAAPQVTRHRLWLDAMQSVLTKNHVVLNTGAGNVIVQFPPPPVPAAAPAASSGAPASAASTSAPASASTPAPGAVPVTSGPAVQGVDR